MNMKLLYGKEARNEMKKGIDYLANAVKSTLGPRGRNVTIFDGSNVAITKDGVTVANSINLADPIQQSGLQMVKEASYATAVKAGDGTTTVTVLAQTIIGLGIELLEKGANPMELKKGIDKAVELVIQSLKKQSVPITPGQVKNVAITSTNNDEVLGTIIAEALDKVGQYGHIIQQQSRDERTWVEHINGLRYEQGFIKPEFMNDPEAQTVDFNNPWIFLVDKKISHSREIMDIVTQVDKTGRPLLIIAEDIDSDALAFMITNKMKGNPWAAIKIPGVGPSAKAALEDISAYTGATIISEQNGRTTLTAKIADLGTASRIVINKYNTTIFEGTGTGVEAKMREINALIAVNDNPYENEKLNQRLARLSLGLAIMHIGAFSEIEAKEKRMRVDDALRACRAAVAEGVLPGGGVAYLRAQRELIKIGFANHTENEFLGFEIILKVMQAPLVQMLKNAGFQDHVIDDIILKVYENIGDYGYNLKTEQWEHLLETGVVDPTKVSRVALEHASSVAGMFLTTDCSIFPDKDNQ